MSKTHQSLNVCVYMWAILYGTSKAANIPNIYNYLIIKTDVQIF